MTTPIYLDYNGTTPCDPEVIAAMRPFLEEEFGNPSSAHWYGIKPRQAVEKARRQVADLLGCEPGEIVFTGGGTESNNHAIKGAALALREKGNRIITTNIEHPAVLDVCRFLEGMGFYVDYLPVDEFGCLDPADVEKAIRPETILISVMHANNEIGTVQPIEAIAALARKRGIRMHTDAAQSIGKIPARVNRLEVDFLSIAGHKLYAPKGIGALFVRKDTPLAKFMHGAGQEGGRRAGTENVMGIVGLGAACEMAWRDLEQNMQRMGRMRDLLCETLRANCPGTRINGHPELSLPNTLSISFRHLDAGRLLEEIGLEVAASAGAACHKAGTEISHVLRAITLEPEWAMGTLRFSTGKMTTANEIEKAAAIVSEAVRRLSASQGQ